MPIHKNTIPESALDDAALEDKLTTPSQKDVEVAAQLTGDVLVLGAAGKMGPSLVARIGRAMQVAGVQHKVIAVVRKDRGDFRSLPPDRVQVVEADLLDAQAFANLPDAPNVIFMIGRKFGSMGDLPLTWATNAWLAGVAASRYKHSNIVAFSTGNVYPFVSTDTQGANEHTTTAPVGEYAQSALARERLFEYFSNVHHTPMVLLRLNYAIDLRYGVLLDICEKVVAGKPIDLATGFVNVIWQGDANSYCFRSLPLCQSPARILNVTGMRKLSVREVAQRFGHHFGKQLNFVGTESATALLSDATQCTQLLGETGIDENQLIDMTAQWVSSGGATLGKPTKFERRDGTF